MSGKPSRFVVQQVHNNNVVLALDAKKQSMVVTGPGVGFGMRRGHVLDPKRIENVYVSESAAKAELAANTLTGLPQEVLDTAHAIIEEFNSSVGIKKTDVLLIPIADHLQQAVRRTEQGIEIEMPLVWEVGQLYPEEAGMGREALAIVEQRLGVRLPPEEATAFALHFVSVNFSHQVIDRTVQMTQSLAEIFALIESYRGCSLDSGSAAAARFVTHLRYLFVRLAEGSEVAEAPQLVQDALEAALPDVMPLARDIATLLTDSWGHELSSSETSYIGLHVHRLLYESMADATSSEGP